ncbi:hypothetical protein D3C85_1634210 [compost metagenome]
MFGKPLRGLIANVDVRGIGLVAILLGGEAVTAAKPAFSCAKGNGIIQCLHHQQHNHAPAPTEGQECFQPLQRVQ